jgi:hypothetical protein
MKEGPGTMTSPGDITPTGRKRYSFKTSLTDDEIRSCVTIYRRLYMENEPANFEKAVALFVRALGDHPYALCVAGFLAQYRKQLDSPPNPPMLMLGKTFKFTTKRLTDVFLYTQYAHQPDEKRQRQFTECLSDVQGDRGVLTFLFLWSLWETGIHIGNAGRWIDRWFQHYCAHHQITPDVLNSLRHEEVGIGAQEKERDRKARLFGEKAEKLATDFWEQAGRPAGGPAQFYPAAHEQLRRALGGGWQG